jgi:hypothetical protein
MKHCFKKVITSQSEKKVHKKFPGNGTGVGGPRNKPVPGTGTNVGELTTIQSYAVVETSLVNLNIFYS